MLLQLRPKQGCIKERDSFRISSRLLLLFIHPWYGICLLLTYFSMSYNTHKTAPSPSSSPVQLPHSKAGAIQSSSSPVCCVFSLPIDQGRYCPCADLRGALILPGFSGIASIQLFCDNYSYYIGRYFYIYVYYLLLLGQERTEFPVDINSFVNFKHPQCFWILIVAVNFCCCFGSVCDNYLSCTKGSFLQVFSAEIPVAGLSPFCQIKCKSVFLKWPYVIFDVGFYFQKTENFHMPLFSVKIYRLILVC